MKIEGDYSTAGDLHFFDHDVTIDGNVLENSWIKVDGNLDVRGSVRKSWIDVSGSARINGTVCGPGLIECGSLFEADSIYDVVVTAVGGAILGFEAVDSAITSGTSIRLEGARGSLKGGSYFATSEIVAGNIGGPSARRTRLFLGVVGFQRLWRELVLPLIRGSREELDAAPPSSGEEDSFSLASDAEMLLVHDDLFKHTESLLFKPNDCFKHGYNLQRIYVYSKIYPRSEFRSVSRAQTFHVLKHGPFEFYQEYFLV
ncbi:MAG: FapA family protein [Planctomycetes bacterium]|nr:FapA family protein [Planctomycetota bacterium]